MVSILAHAQQLVYILVSLMPSQYQRDNLQAMLGLFLEAQGHPPGRKPLKTSEALFALSVGATNYLCCKGPRSFCAGFLVPLGNLLLLQAQRAISRRASR